MKVICTNCGSELKQSEIDNLYYQCRLCGHDTKRFYPAEQLGIKDNNILFLCPCNHNMSYAILSNGNFALVNNPSCTNIINGIIDTFDNLKDCRKRFFELQ